MASSAEQVDVRARGLPVEHIEWQATKDGATGLYTSTPKIPMRTVADVLGRKLECETGIHIIFMPNIEKELKRAPKVCQELADQFHLPKFFFKKTGWDANSFFGSREDPILSIEGKNYTTFSRFLTKEIAARDGKVEYEWQFLAFCTLWRSAKFKKSGESLEGNEITRSKPPSELQLLLCFDLNPKMQKNVSEAVGMAQMNSFKEDPFALLSVISLEVVEQFDRALWTFQPAIRDFEKTRTEHTPPKTEDRPNEERRYTELGTLHKRYTDMHELSRHVIHISETLKVASSSLVEMTNAHHSFSTLFPLGARGDGQSEASQQIRKELQLSSNLLSNLQSRAQAFVDRLQNEIQLAYNIVAAVDNSNSRGILDQTRNDGKALSDTVSIMTLLFLPGTFISGFFGMNFFKLADSGSWSVSTDVYIFFACAGPVTLIGFILFILELNIIPWTRRHISRPFKRWVLRQRHYLITSGDAPMKDGGQKDSV